MAVLARTSTLALQDPAASLRRQLTSTREWLPPGFYVAAICWDVESGALDLERRGHRSRVRCTLCRRRMAGITRSHPDRDNPAGDYAYHVCTHDPASPRHG